MNIKFKTFFGLAQSGYYHIPILYLAFGKDGFCLTICGLSIIIKLK